MSQLAFNNKFKRKNLAFAVAVACLASAQQAAADPRSGSIALTASITNGEDIDGQLGAGYLVTGDSRFTGSSSITVGTTTDQTLIHNFSTQGGAGSGGGAGLGGVFFVDSNATLTLINTDLKSNRVQGGAGGGDPTYRFKDDSRTISGASVNLVVAVANGVKPNDTGGIAASTTNGIAYEISSLRVQDDVKPLLETGFNLTFTEYNNEKRQVDSLASGGGVVSLSSAIQVADSDVLDLSVKTSEVIGTAESQAGFYFSSDGKSIKFTREAKTGDDQSTDAVEPNDHTYYETVAGLDNITVGSLIVVPGAGSSLQYTTVKSLNYNAQGELESLVLDDVVADAASATAVDVLPPIGFQASPFRTVSSTGTSSSDIEVYGDLTNFKQGMDVTWEEDGEDKTATITNVVAATDSTPAVITINSVVGDGVLGLEAVENPLVSDDGTTSVVRIAGAAANYKVNEQVFVPDSTGQIAFTGEITAISGDEVTIQKQSGSSTLTELYVPSVGLGVLRSSAVVNDNQITIPLGAEVNHTILVGRELEGDDFNEGTTVTAAVRNSDGSVTLTLSAAPTNADQLGFFKVVSPLAKGGNMNNIANVANSTNGDGSDGNSADSWTSYFEGGDGGDGNNGQSADDPDNGVGFDGGDGGSGSDGMNSNPLLAYDLVVASYGVVAASSEVVFAGMDLAGVISPDILLTFPSGTTAPDPVEIAAKSVKLGFTIADLAFATADLALVAREMAQWNSQLANGLAGRGGDGGQGGEGSGGADFFGGGTGGDGGDGGDGGQDSTHGGDAGDGGRGGDGGFGAGGGSGGDGGSGGRYGFAYDGDPGDGGFGGFGAGDGMRGDGLMGNGGSGFGGAVFVREAGTLNVQGNALFELNYVAGGSTSSALGTAGTSAGSDLFIMKGADVTLSPGLGKEIRFEGDIADDSRATDDDFANASGEGADITIAGAGGLVTFNGENTYSGHTILEGASLTAQLGTGVHDDSLIRFNGAGTLSADSNAATVADRVVSTMSLASTGTLLLQHDYSRRAGSDPGETSWTGSGGFASSVEGGVTVNLGKLDEAGRGQQLVWGADAFFVNSGAGAGENGFLTFGSELSVDAVTFNNRVDLNNKLGRVAVYNTNNAADLAESKATLTGVWENGALLVGDAESDYDGVLHALADNELTALFSTGGVLTTYNSDVPQASPVVPVMLLSATSTSTASHGTLFDDTASALMFENSNVHVFADDTLTSAGVNPTANLVLAADLSTTTATGSGDFANAGNVFIFGEGYESNETTINALRLNYLPNNYADWSGGLDVAGTLTNSADTGNIFQAGTLAASSLVNNGTINVVAFSDSATQARTLEVAQLSGTGTIAMMDTVYTDEEGVDTTITPDLVIDHSGSSEFAGVISGSGDVTKVGAGHLQISNAQTFTGDFSVSEGHVETLTGGTFADVIRIQVASGAQMTVRQDDTVNKVTVDAGATYTQDADVTTTTGIVQNGDLDVVSNVTLTTGTEGLTGAGDVTVSANQYLTVAQSADSEFSGSITGYGGFVKTKAGTLTLSGAANSVNLAGELVVEDGTLALDGSGILAAASQVVVRKDATAGTEGTLSLVTGHQAIQSLAGEGVINLGNGNRFDVVNGGEFTGRVMGRGHFNVEGGDFSVSSSIASDEGVFTVDSGSGTRTSVAAGANLTFPTVMVAADSELHLGSSDTQQSLVQSDHTMVSGALRGKGRLTGLTTIQSGGLLSPGDSPGVVTFDQLQLASGGTTLMEIAGFGAPGAADGYDQLVANQMIVESGAVLTLADLRTDTTTPLFDRNDRVELFAVPNGSITGQFAPITPVATLGEVALNIATGELVGLGSGGVAALQSLAQTPNQQSAMAAYAVNTSGVTQFYGGRLATDLLEAVDTGGSTARVFELSSPEAYRGVAEYSVFAMDQLSVSPQRFVLDGEEATSVRLVGGNRDSQTLLGFVDYDVRNQGVAIQNDMGTSEGVVSFAVHAGTGEIGSRDLNVDVRDFGFAGGFTHAFDAVEGLESSFSVGLISNSFDSTRATTSGESKASFNGKSTFFGAGVGYTADYGQVTARFALDATYKDVEIKQAMESNAVDVLNARQIDQQNQAGTETKLGVDLSWSASNKLRLSSSLSVVDSDMDDETRMTSRVASESVTATTTSRGLERNYGTFGIGADYSLGNKEKVQFRASTVGSDGAKFSLSYLFR